MGPDPLNGSTWHELALRVLHFSAFMIAELGKTGSMADLYSNYSSINWAWLYCVQGVQYDYSCPWLIFGTL